LELSQLAAYEMYGADEVSSAGIITGIGSINGFVFEMMLTNIKNTI
jgi:hypothetical protein